MLSAALCTLMRRLAAGGFCIKRDGTRDETEWKITDETCTEEGGVAIGEWSVFAEAGCVRFCHA